MGRIHLLSRSERGLMTSGKHVTESQLNYLMENRHRPHEKRTIFLYCMFLQIKFHKISCSAPIPLWALSETTFGLFDTLQTLTVIQIIAELDKVELFKRIFRLNWTSEAGVMFDMENIWGREAWAVFCDSKTYCLGPYLLTDVPPGQAPASELNGSIASIWGSLRGALHLVQVCLLSAVDPIAPISYHATMLDWKKISPITFANPKLS
jgi:hypothetical protein